MSDRPAWAPIVCLAPMAGITDWPLRVLCFRMGADYACSEMVSAMGLMCAKEGNTAYAHLLAVSPEEPNIACQLFGRDPLLMAEAAAKITAMKRFSSIDINMGCPAHKVVGSGEGSALLKNPDLAFRILEAVKVNTDLPVTVKMRLGYDEGERSALPVAQAAQTIGLKWVAVHGRTRAQQYSGHADWEAIGELKAKLRIPVLANGDVFTPQDAAEMLRVTGADGVMAGRGAMGNPWLFRGIKCVLAGEDIPQVSLRERIDTALLQSEWMVAYKGERLGIVEMRKHINHYIAGIRGAADIRRSLNLVSTFAEVRQLLAQLLASQEALEETTL